MWRPGQVIVRREVWHGTAAWRGHGVVMLHRPADAYAVWVF